MIDQMDGGIYNVNYNNKNNGTGSFELESQKVGNQWKITVSNIQHEGYVSNWQVKYKLSGDEYWKSTENLEFYVPKAGYYIVKVVHGDEINLGKKQIDITE